MVLCRKMCSSALLCRASTVRATWKKVNGHLPACCSHHSFVHHVAMVVDAAPGAVCCACQLHERLQEAVCVMSVCAQNRQCTHCSPLLDQGYQADVRVQMHATTDPNYR